MAKVFRRYPCVTECFFRHNLYREGDTLETDLPATQIPAHFKGGKLKTAAVKEAEARAKKEKGEKKVEGSTRRIAVPKDPRGELNLEVESELDLDAEEGSLDGDPDPDTTSADDEE